MDEVINRYFDTKYTPERAELLYRALGLFTVYRYSEPIMTVINAIHLTQIEGDEDISDYIDTTMHQGLDRILLAKRIQLSPETELSDKVLITEASYAFYYQEDYTPHLAILKNDFLSPREKFIAVVMEITDMEEADLLEIVEDVYVNAIDGMIEFAESQSDPNRSNVDLELQGKVRRNLLVYRKAFGIPAISNTLESLQLEVGQSFDIYFQLLGGELLNLGDMESTTYGLLWIALISHEGIENPQKLLMEKSDLFFDNIQQLNEFNSMLSKAMGRWQDFKEHLV